MQFPAAGGAQVGNCECASEVADVKHLICGRAEQRYSKQINQTPGADQTNSLAMITDLFLALRGARSAACARRAPGGVVIDGVPVLNTNIASNVGRNDPRTWTSSKRARRLLGGDGDRAYSVFNVVTRSGFERNKEAELITSYGNYN